MDLFKPNKYYQGHKAKILLQLGSGIVKISYTDDRGIRRVASLLETELESK